jgi:hypothetical protein
MKLEIEKELAQEVLNYLVQKPYGEVALLISKIMALKPIEEKPKEEIPK